MRVAHVGEVVELGRDEAAHERRLQLVEQQPDARHERAATAAARPGRAARRCRATTRATSRSMSCTPSSVSRSLPRSVERNAKLLDGVEPILDALERQRAAAAATRAAAARPSTSRCDRSRASSDPGAPPSAPSTTSRCRSVDGIDRAGRRRRVAERDVAHVREIGLLRVAQVVHEGAGGARSPPCGPSSPKPVEAVRACSCSSSARRADSRSNVQPSTRRHAASPGRDPLHERRAIARTRRRRGARAAAARRARRPSACGRRRR